MLLTVEKSVSETAKVANEILELEDKLKQTSSTLEVFNKKFQELQGNIQSFEEKNKDLKLKKLECDSQDYTENWVHKQLKISESNQKRVSADTRNNIETSEIDESDNTSTEEGPPYSFRSSRGPCKTYSEYFFQKHPCKRHKKIQW